MPHRDPKDPATLAQAEKMLQRIDKMYKLGLKAPGPRSNLREASRRKRVSPRVLRQARQFADAFDEAELKQFKSLRRPNGLPLHFGHVVWLLTVKARRDRKALARKAAKNDWTAPMLHTHLKGSRAPVSKGQPKDGRPIKVPQDAQLAVQQLAREGDLWERRAEETVKRIRERGSPEQAACENLLATMERMRKSYKAMSKELKQHLAETA